MKVTHPKNHRIADRMNAALGVFFSVNGGAQHYSATMNLTNRSLAIRSNVPVRKGDDVRAMINDLPLLDGKVVRVFDEGFAIRLAEPSFALVAHAADQIRASAPEETGYAGLARETRRIIGAFERIDAQAASWARLATALEGRAGSTAHIMTIITTADLPLRTIRNVWLEVGQNRWIARLIRMQKRGGQIIIAISLNDLQMRLATNVPMKLAIATCEDRSGCHARIKSSLFRRQLMEIEKRDGAASLLSHAEQSRSISPPSQDLALPAE